MGIPVSFAKRPVTLFEIEDLIKEEQVVITLSHFGYVKRMPVDTYKSQRRGGKGITGMATREEDFVKQIFTASTHDTLLFFTNQGKVYRLRGYEVPEAGRTAKGTAIVNLLSLGRGEKISAVITLSNFAEGKYLLMGTKKGMIKKTPLVEYDTVRKSGLQAITLKEDDELIDVRMTDGEDNVVLVTRQGLCITFEEKDVRPIGRTGQGVIGIKLNDGDDVIGMEPIVVGSKATLLAITENGFGKRTELDEYRVQTRGGKGVITYKTTPKTGEIVGIRIATDDEDVMLITNTGTIIRINVKDISVLGRATQGVTLMRTNDGGKVVAIAKVSETELTAYTTKHTELLSEKTKLGYSVTELEREIKKLQSITDTCPTCGQHLPNVTKPDTSMLEAELIQSKATFAETCISLKDCDAKHAEYQIQITEAFTAEITELSNKIAFAKQRLISARTELTRINSEAEALRTEFSRLSYDKQNWDSRVDSQLREIASHEAEIVRLTNVINITSLSKDDYSERLSIIKKMDTLIRRDFRGYLLSNIIAYLDSRAKEYCSTVFGTKELSLSLNGNALDITYCGKIFDGLSGGEKQRVDLILQLAIRDMLTSYLDLSANILVLDEITDFLDKKSCRAVMQLLETKLNSVESVFIISHHAEELELPIDSEIRIIKNADGISEVM